MMRSRLSCPAPLLWDPNPGKLLPPTAHLVGPADDSIPRGHQDPDASDAVPVPALDRRLSVLVGAAGDALELE